MKKVLVVLMAALMVFSVAACGGKKASTPAGTLAEAFKEAAKDSNASAEDLANTLSTNEIIPFMAMAMPLEADSWFPGFTENPTGFTSAASFGPAISTIPFIGYVFEVDGDAEAFAKSLDSITDLGWNVCTRADEKKTEIVGNKVFFVMAPNTFDEEQ